MKARVGDHLLPDGEQRRAGVIIGLHNSCLVVIDAAACEHPAEQTSPEPDFAGLVRPLAADLDL